MVVDLKRKEILVEYDEARLTLDDIRRAVERADVRRSLGHRLRELFRRTPQKVPERRCSSPTTSERV